MLIVRTKDELKRAKKDKVSEFRVVGDLAFKIMQAQKVSTLSKRTVYALAGVGVVGVAATPFTAGGSLALSATAATATLGTTATVAMISAGGALLLFTIFKNYSFKIEVDPKSGKVSIDFTSKSHKKMS
jgi:hypothetical protein